MRRHPPTLQHAACGAVRVARRPRPPRHQRRHRQFYAPHLARRRRRRRLQRGAVGRQRRSDLSHRCHPDRVLARASDEQLRFLYRSTRGAAPRARALAQAPHKTELHRQRLLCTTPARPCYARQTQRRCHIMKHTNKHKDASTHGMVARFRTALRASARALLPSFGGSSGRGCGRCWVSVHARSSPGA